MRSHALKVGAWTVESAQAQERLSFETLYSWLGEQHSKREWHFIKDPTTKKNLHRYKLAFKRMKVPPDTQVMFKYKKGGKRLSDWIIKGSSGTQTVGIPQGIIDMLPPTIAHPPPGAAQRNARADTAWARGRTAQQRRSRLRSVLGDSEDAQETRNIVDAVMQESGAYSTESDEELEAELERALEEEEGDVGGAGPSQGGGDVPLALDEVQRTLMADSDEDDEGAVGVERENDEGGSGAGVGVSSDGDGLSDYERQRKKNIECNEARLRELGLLNDPLIPSRPKPPPRRHPQPLPRVQAEGPHRASGRIQGLPRPAYADIANSDEEKDSEEEGEAEDESPQQGQEDGPPPQQVPRRSTRVVDSAERESFSMISYTEKK